MVNKYAHENSPEAIQLDDLDTCFYRIAYDDNSLRNEMLIQEIVHCRYGVRALDFVHYSCNDLSHRMHSLV